MARRLGSSDKYPSPSRKGKRRSVAYTAAKTLLIIAGGGALASALQSEWLLSGGAASAVATGGVGQHRRLAGGLAHVLFGAADYLSPLIGAVSMVIVVFCVICTEAFFEGLNHMAHDTPFEELITAIENEMMIVGFMAFLLKIILNLTTIPSDWLLALEYADLVVPMITFTRCFIGIGFIYMSIKVCEHWGKSYHLHHLLVMDAYLDRSHSFWARGHMSWVPLSWTNGAMEFRIFHHIFCEHFMIQRSAFAFDEYVHRIFEKFLLRIIGMHEVDWFLICVMTLLNWLRLQYGLDMHDCFREKGALKYCKTMESECMCHKVSSMENYTISGFTVLAFTISLAIISRVYELRIMATRGVHTSDDYALYLESAEKESANQVVSDRKRFNAETLKQAVARVKELAEMENAKTENWWLSFVIDNSHECFLTLTCPACLMRRGAGSHHRCGRYFEPGNRSKLGKIVVEDFADDEFGEEDGGKSKSSRSSTSSPKAPTLGANLALTDPINTQQDTNMLTAQARSFAHRTLGEMGEKMSRRDPSKDRQAQLTKGSLDAIFIFNSPQLYFGAVAITMMLVSFYLALWVTNFAASATEIGKDVQLFWQLVSLCPGLFSAVIYAYSVRVASLLLAVTQIDHDAVEEILEQTEGAKHLQTEMREKILAKLEEIGDPREELRALFQSIDDNGSGLLSRKEFQIFLNELNITFSRRKWAQIFAEIDKDNSDEIDYNELFLFIFPDSNEARRMERRRVQDMQRQVAKKADSMLDKHRRESLSIQNTSAKLGGGMFGQTVASIKSAFVPSTVHTSQFVLTTLAEGSSSAGVGAGKAGGGGGKEGGVWSPGSSFDEQDEESFQAMMKPKAAAAAVAGTGAGAGARGGGASSSSRYQPSVGETTLEELEDATQDQSGSGRESASGSGSASPSLKSGGGWNMASTRRSAL